MVRKYIAGRALILVVAIVGCYLIINLFVKDKNWGAYSLAVAGFASLPVLATMYVKTLNILPASKVIIITAIWATWVVLAGIVAFATYYYWYNDPAFNGICPGGLCTGSDINQ